MLPLSKGKELIPYQHSELEKELEPPRIILNYINKLISMPQSVLDMGCGLGAFLNVYHNLGVVDFLGIDGNWVNVSELLIPKDKFLAHDLTQEITLNRKFDLAICLEVAEHLPPNAGDVLVNNIVNHANTIIFSAAPSMQGGQNHINEQPFDYWFLKFEKRGFVILDIFRSMAWNISEIPWWYRQNIFVITQRQTLINNFTDYIVTSKSVNYYVHPQNFIDKMYKLETRENSYQFIIQGKASVLFYVKLLMLRFLNLFIAGLKRIWSPFQL